MLFQREHREHGAPPHIGFWLKPEQYVGWLKSFEVDIPDEEDAGHVANAEETATFFAVAHQSFIIVAKSRASILSDSSSGLFAVDSLRLCNITSRENK